MNPQQFTISMFQGIGDSRPKMVQRSWARLCMNFAKPMIRQEKDGLLFSPAKYRAPRRLIANVIELSLLVLEVDGAWQCNGCGYKAPLILFRNAKHDGDRCQKCRKAKRPEPHSVSQIHFDLAMLIADVRNAFHSTFAIYSTHSHRHVTDKNPLAEPRYRIVVPLTKPVPIGQFPELWEKAVNALQVVPADPQVKDPNRIYYTPVKFCEEAIYEYFIEEGEPLNWERVLRSKQPIEQTASGSETGPGVVGKHSPGAVDPGALPSAVSATTQPVERSVLEKGDTTVSGEAVPTSRPTRSDVSVPDYYSSHEARHEELCRRIAARGKQNSRGNYDARCLAHGGKGTTALLYNPHSGAVACNRGCDYNELLVAEGLPDYIIKPNQQHASAASPLQPASAAVSPLRTGAANQPRGSMGSVITPPLITAARLHVINALLLAHCFSLTEEDAERVQKHWGSPYSKLIEWPGTDEKKPVKVCSFPSPHLQLEAVKRLSQEFNLEGVPGIFRTMDLPGPEAPERRDHVAEYGPWRFNFPTSMRPGALIGPYDNGSGFILGIRIFKSVKDKSPFLLTSRGLPSGSSAVGLRSVAA